MNFEEKLKYYCHVKPLFGLLQKWENFNEIRNELQKRGIINTNHWLDLSEMNIKNGTIEDLLKEMYNFKFCDIVDILRVIQYQPFNEIAKKMTSAENFWKFFVDERKKKTKLLDFNITFFAPENSVKLDHFKTYFTDVQIRKMQKKNMSEKEPVDTDITYIKFYKVFERPFNDILVEGEHGIGKSILMKNLLYTWCNNIWDQSNEKIVFYLDFKKISSERNIYEEIKIQNFEQEAFITSDIIENIFSRRPQDIILFLDEVDTKVQEKNKLHDIIYKECQFSKIVFCREETAREIEMLFNQHFLLTGFSFENLEEFFSKCFNNKRKGKKFAKKHAFKIKETFNKCKVPKSAMELAFNEKENMNIFIRLLEFYDNLPIRVKIYILGFLILCVLIFINCFFPTFSWYCTFKCAMFNLCKVRTIYVQECNLPENCICHKFIWETLNDKDYAMYNVTRRT